VVPKPIPDFDGVDTSSLFGRQSGVDPASSHRKARVMTYLSDDINDYCFLDSETRPLPGTLPPYDDVTKCGAYAYAPTAEAVIWTYTIGDEPVDATYAARFGHYDVEWKHLNPRVRQFHKRAAAGEAWFVAWNMGFDRQIWNSQPTFPELTPEMTLDAMAQGAASNLPGGLEDAGTVLGLGGKDKRGKGLMKLFASPEGPQPDEAPAEWQEYIGYGVRDTELLRDIWKATRPLPASEWAEYWASERINDRGIAVDVDFARRAAQIAEADRTRTNAMLPGLTGGALKTIMQHVKIAEWLYDNVGSAEARDMLVSRYDEDDENEVVAAKLSAERPRVEALLAYYDALEETNDGLTDDEIAVATLLELRQFGASSSPKKFAKMLDQVDPAGRLCGQYVFNGAMQTGRYSSKGVQTHNLPRKSLGEHEAEAIEMINELEVT